MAESKGGGWRADTCGNSGRRSPRDDAGPSETNANTHVCFWSKHVPYPIRNEEHIYTRARSTRELQLTGYRSQCTLTYGRPPDLWYLLNIKSQIWFRRLQITGMSTITSINQWGMGGEGSAPALFGRRSTLCRRQPFCPEHVIEDEKPPPSGDIYRSSYTALQICVFALTRDCVNDRQTRLRLRFGDDNVIVKKTSSRNRKSRAPPVRRVSVTALGGARGAKAAPALRISDPIFVSVKTIPPLRAPRQTF